MILRQYILRILLSYRGWMNVTERRQPKRVILWGLLVRLVSGYQPSLYSFQRSLPRMPVPTLRETIHKLFESLKPVCSEEELSLLKKQSKVSSKSQQNYFLMIFSFDPLLFDLFLGIQNIDWPKIAKIISVKIMVNTKLCN